MKSNWFTYRNILTVLIILFTCWFIYNFYPIIAYFLIAAVISLLGRPIVVVLDKIKIGKFNFPRWLSALVAIATIISVIIGILWLFVPLIVEQAAIISSIDTQKVASSLEKPLLQVQEFILQFQSTSADKNVTLDGLISDRLQEWINITSLSNIINGLLAGVGNVIVAIFSIIFISFFFLRDEKLFYQISIALTPTKFESNARRILHSSKKTLTRYFVGIILQSMVVFVLVAAGLWLMGFKYALLIGFFCAIVNVIPYLGPIIGTLFAILVELTTTLNEFPDANIATIIIQLIALIQGVQLFDNYISQPIIFSNSVNAHPLEIFFIVLVFGSLAGIPGMILAVPTYSFMRIIAREFFSEYKLVQQMTENID